MLTFLEVLFKLDLKKNIKRKLIKYFIINEFASKNLAKIRKSSIFVICRRTYALNKQKFARLNARWILLDSYSNNY